MKKTKNHSAKEKPLIEDDADFIDLMNQEEVTPFELGSLRGVRETAKN